MFSRRIFAAVAILCAFVAPSHAQKTKSQINTEIGTNFPDNTAGQITPQNLRTVTGDIVNSTMPTAPVVPGNVPCFDGTTGLTKDCGAPAVTSATSPIQLGPSGVLSCPTCATSGNSPYVLPSDYGITCDGTTDWHTQLQTMINASAGKTILIPAGPACATSVTLTLPSNTHIKGLGRESSIVKSLTATANPLFAATNKTNIELDSFWCQGSDSITSWAASSIGCFAFVQDSSALTSGQNINIHDMKFSGFNATYWNYFNAGGSTPGVVNVTFSNNYVMTAASDIPTDPTTSNNANYGIVIFSGSGGKGQFLNTQIKNNRFEAANMCFPLVLFGNHYRWQITENLILQPGQVTPHHCDNGGATTINAYGVLVYDLWSDGNPPTNGMVSNNTILNPYSSGIYFAGDGNPAHTTTAYNSFQAVIEGNNIATQTSSDDAQLPRAAIAINDATDVTVVGNYLYNNYGGIAFTAQNSGTVSAIGNHCTSGSGTSNCISMSSGTNGSSNTDRRIIRGNHLDSTGTTIRAFSATGARFFTVDISGNEIIANGTGVNFASQFVNSLNVTNNTFLGSGTLASLSGITGGLSISNNTNLSFTAAALPAASNGSSVFVSDGAPASACTGGSSGSMAFRQNNAWKCF